MGIQGYNVARASWLNNFNNNANANANNRNINNSSRVRGIAQHAETSLWNELCSTKNLYSAYKKASKHKTQKPYVLDFEKHLLENLQILRSELLLHSYTPRPLQTFILRDPKTRKISKSDFRDRVVHHALYNVIEPLFDKSFIFDSYANRKGKGTLKAIQRFEQFRQKLSQNNTRTVYVLKADIRHYFDEVDHHILLTLLQRKISDAKVLWLIKRIISNYSTTARKGMPLGNLTSQFFANVYLHELDFFIKQKLKVKHYIRYVDDFVILHNSESKVSNWKTEIQTFLENNLLLAIHPDKSKLYQLHNGVCFLGLKIFSYHKIIKRKNIRMCKTKFRFLCRMCLKKEINYDMVYDFVEGWNAYSKNTDMYKVCQYILCNLEKAFPGKVSSKEIDRHLKSQRHLNLPSIVCV